MFQVICSTKIFQSSLRKYAAISGKDIFDAIKDEARLIAQRIMKVTPPKTQAKGKKKIGDDIKRVYLTNEWFLEKFEFNKLTLGDRVKELIRGTNESALKKIVANSPKMDRIFIESFNPSTLERFRHNGKVPKGVAPYSYPVSNQSGILNLIAKKQLSNGMAKAGWGACIKKLGGTVAGWLGKGDKGEVIIDEVGQSVTIINKVEYAANLDARGNFSNMVCRGRDKELATKIDITLKKLHL